MEQIYAGFITNLPEADISFEGVKGWLSQSGNHQVVFLEIDAIGEVAEHRHGAQWGIVVQGEMDLTVAGVTRTCRKGDTYFIPAGVLHSAVFREKTWAIDVFADKDRYLPKE